MAGGVGAAIDAPAGVPAHGWLFGEDQSRYLLTASQGAAGRIIAAAEKAGVPAVVIGSTGGNALTLHGQEPILISDLVSAHEGWFPKYMAAAI